MVGIKFDDLDMQGGGIHETSNGRHIKWKVAKAGRHPPQESKTVCYFYSLAFHACSNNNTTLNHNIL